MKASLIAIEGIDGSGKTTQVNLVAQYLTRQNIPHQVINFPRYGENIYAGLITRYLAGKFGSNVNPYLIALAYAGDRFLAKPLIESWLQEGKVVLANRYVSSSKAHLGANLPEDKKEEFLSWLEKLEYQTNQMPKPGLTILLKVDPAVGQSNVLKDHPVDIHEKNEEHGQISAQIYDELAQLEGWKVVDCMENGKMRKQEEISKMVIEIFRI
ncbi:hypothetical protein HY384_02925 [Candidatus Daviesbacteria bacterium]|nr:hypothetical protein [Candidatus Daviesbacteria bacterium]